MTPDGIPAPEWNRVHELAVEIANAAMGDDHVLSEVKTEEMLSYLRQLRARHGDLPSILGTMADYLDDEVQQYDLYARAIAESRRIGDGGNLAMLLESILELERLDAEQRAFWTAQLSGARTESLGSGNTR